MGIKNPEVFEQDFIEICNVIATAAAQEMMPDEIEEINPEEIWLTCDGCSHGIAIKDDVELNENGTFKCPECGADI